MNHWSLLVQLYILSTQPAQAIQESQKSESYPQDIHLKEINEEYYDKVNRTKRSKDKTKK